MSGVKFFDLPVFSPVQEIFLLVRLAALLKFLRDCSDHIAVFGFVPRLDLFSALFYDRWKRDDQSSTAASTLVIIPGKQRTNISAFANRTGGAGLQE
jgi:hypothetical protein